MAALREIRGDLWEYHAAGAVVAITTNGKVSRNGGAVMTRGCARQARDRFPHLAGTLGGLVLQYGNHVFDLGGRLVSFPVEDDPCQMPDLRLIAQSSRELVALVDKARWPQVVVPRPGCGCGGLAWNDVRPILARAFDARFLIISNEE